MKRFARAAAAALLGLGALGHAELARACSVCRQETPRYSSAGSTVQEQGGFSFYLEYQGWRKTSGLLPEEPGEPAPPGREVDESQMLTAYLSYTPLDRLTLTLHVPFRFNENIEEPLEEERSRNTLTGFGDLAVTGSYLLWRSREVLPDSGRGARLPEGPDGKRQQEGQRRVRSPPPARHRLVGLRLRPRGRHRTSWGSLYASVFERINPQGALDYRFGNDTLREPRGRGAPRSSARRPDARPPHAGLRAELPLRALRRVRRRDLPGQRRLRALRDAFGPASGSPGSRGGRRPRCASQCRSP